MDTNNTSLDQDKQTKLALSTPNWMKPKKEGDNLFAKNPALNYEQAMHNFQTPELKKQTKNGTNTPLDQLFAKAIDVAYANTQIPNFYKKYDSPQVCDYSFDKSYNNKAMDSVATGGETIGNAGNEEDDRIAATPCELKKIQQTLR